MARNPDLDSLAQLTWRVYDVLEDTARALGLSPTQLRLLAILRDREPEILELARHLGLDKSSASGLIARAEEKGLVERVTSESDRRRVSVRLTDAGRSQADRLEAQTYDALEAVLAHVPRRERQTFAETCRRVLGSA